MAFEAPKIIGPDGVARQQFIFSTTINSRFFTGTIDAATVDMEVSIRGGGFTSDPDYIIFEGESFTIPNPAVFPDGLELLAGKNIIEIRAISATGALSDIATVTTRLIQESDIGVVPTPPTNISVERLDQSVIITAEGVDDANVVSYNFYASRFAGGGETGYIRINAESVVDPSDTREDVSELTDFEIDVEIATNPDGTPAADPLYLKLFQSQQNAPDDVEKIEDVDLSDDEFAAALIRSEASKVIQTDLNRAIEIAETVTNLRTNFTLSSVRPTDFYSFEHNRTSTLNSDPKTIPNGDFAATPADEPLFYVVTAVFYDSSNQIELESAYSIEVVASPLNITIAVSNLPQVTKAQIQTVTQQAILRPRPGIRVDPGSVLRDTYIDPFSSEAERVRFILDFLHRAQSFTTLLQIDGVDENGDPIPVSNSAYKLALRQAFFLENNDDAQAVVDQAFEELAANRGVFRRPGKNSRGLITYYLETQPTRTYNFPEGTTVLSGTVSFQSTAAATIPLEQVASFYNAAQSRFEVTASIRATAPGSAGNLGPGQIRALATTIPGVSVINTADTYGGDDRDSNLELAIRASNRVASVDSGTARGYLQIAADTPGVREALVIEGGNELMLRDFDEATKTHFGCKVDIYVRGRNEALVTDSFAFTFDIAQNIQFAIVGDPLDLTFKALDDRLSQENPIAEMLDDQTLNYGLQNATTGLWFDLTDVAIIDFDTIQLSSTVPQPAYDFGDVILGDYRFRTGTEFVLPRQPVTEVISVTGSESGPLPTDAYQLVRPNSVLRDGGSVHAGAFIRVVGSTDVDGNPVPSGEILTKTDESHVFIGDFPEFLNNLGINLLTIQVYNSDKTVLYKGPNDPAGSPDYTIVPGDQTTPVSLLRVETGAISSGQSVLVDYRYEENFAVEYNINQIVSTMQDEIDDKKHATADVLGKQAVEVPVNLAATVVLNRTAQTETVDREARTNLQGFFDTLSLGTPVRQSDIIGVLENTVGVSFVVTPITTLVRAPGAPVTREILQTSQVGDTTKLDAYSTENVFTYLINETLASATTDGGGSQEEFRGVFEDDVELDLVLTNPQTLGVRAGQAFIIGNNGQAIPGFSDDATLQAEYPTATPADLEAIRLQLTANRVMISLSKNDFPADHSYFVTYIVGEGNTGVKNINPAGLESLILGDVQFTFDEDREAP